MDHEGDLPPPFWFQPPTSTIVRQRRRPSSPILNPVVLIILVPILALLLFCLVVPPLVSHTSQILRPNSIKKGWDSLNIILVLFAILCGVFLRKNDDDDLIVAENRSTAVVSSISSNDLFEEKVINDRLSSSQWFDGFGDRKVYISSPARVLESGGGRLRRSSSSYPDLRQDSLWEAGTNRSRFYDDFDLNVYRSPVAEDVPRRSEVEREDSDIKVIPVDTYVARNLAPSDEVMQSSPPPLSPSPPPSSQPEPQAQPVPEQSSQAEEAQPQPVEPPPRPVKLKRRRSVRSVPHKENLKRRSEIDHFSKVSNSRSPTPLPSPPPPPLSPPPPPPPLPPPPPPPSTAAVNRSPDSSETLERKKSGTTKEIATAIASFYNRTKITKKKKKNKTRNTNDNAADSLPSAHSSISPPSPPPPPPLPPPPPPPPSVFHNMFKKGSKSKRIHSVSSSVKSPPPPPPPPNSIFNNIFKNNGKSKRFSSASGPPPPPPPPPPSSILNNLFKTGTTSKRFYSVSSTQSPPSPPPLPQQSHRRKPPLPRKASNYYENLGSQSPVVSIPPPPPLPPFKMREVKFKARGDFVRLRSSDSSRGSSPELEDVEVESRRESPSAVEGGNSGGGLVFCPSPDVNTKADNFIARLRDEWRLEKMNSIRAKQH